MMSDWFIWCVVKNELKARRLLERTVDHLGGSPSKIMIERDADIPGYSVHFQISVSQTSWNDAVVELLHIGKKVADRWIVTPGSSIYEYAAAFSDDCRVPGVRRIQWEIERDSEWKNCVGSDLG